MSRPSIVENNELLNADDYDLRYRNTEAKIRLERPDLWAYVLQVRGPEGEQPIAHLPRPGDTIRDNTSDQPLRVVRVYDGWSPGQINIEAKTLDRGSTSYFNGYRLENGRLLGRQYTPGMAGHNIYNQGQPEIFILRRAYQVLPHGRMAVMQAMPDLFA